MVKGIDSAFDHMELCSVLQDEVLKAKIDFYTVQPLYNGHLWDSIKVAVVTR